MAVSNIKATFSCDLKDVWEIVTSLDDYSWRSDLSKITRLNEKQFVEYTKDGLSKAIGRGYFHSKTIKQRLILPRML